jgi:hypothetical protein
MKKNILKKIAIPTLSALTLICTLMLKNAAANVTDDEGGEGKHACVYVIPSPGEVSYDCSSFGTVCSTASDCKLK